MILHADSPDGRNPSDEIGAADGPKSEFAGAGAAMFQLVRFWSRRGTAAVPDELTGELRRVQDVQVLEAMNAAARATTEVSVSDVAHQLGIDRSGASRFIADAAGHGYLRRVPSARDGRRAVLVVTEAGQDLLTRAHAWQDEKFAALTAHWQPEDAARLGHYLRRLAEEVTDPRQQSQM
ncbi:MarR family winged helix-turn-helix transcriptional regulator [Pseudofrankia sp. BMG5.36]|uniref:MarR family winged helix-turn-helix transcriptional regulator n=1 Tax=Pseudofrankia sp. BMG5.36 TaxID=1834512 RepID=UPI0018E32714|nr:MarR family winged helix-turn-helix transcriptional regulator [Pseudofrankia sp. BMG5.36]